MAIPKKSLLSFAEELKQILDTPRGNAVIQSSIENTGNNELAKTLAAMGNYKLNENRTDEILLNKESAISSASPGTDLRTTGPARTRRAPQPTIKSLQPAFNALNRSRRVSEFTPQIGGT